MAILVLHSEVAVVGRKGACRATFARVWDVLSWRDSWRHNLWDFFTNISLHTHDREESPYQWQYQSNMSYYTDHTISRDFMKCNSFNVTISISQYCLASHFEARPDFVPASSFHDTIIRPFHHHPQLFWFTFDISPSLRPIFYHSSQFFGGECRRIRGISLGVLQL